MPYEHCEEEEEEKIVPLVWPNVRMISKSIISAQRALNGILTPEMDSPQKLFFALHQSVGTTEKWQILKVDYLGNGSFK